MLSEPHSNSYAPPSVTSNIAFFTKSFLILPQLSRYIQRVWELQLVVKLGNREGRWGFLSGFVMYYSDPLRRIKGL